MQKVEYPISQQAKAFIDAFNSLSDATRAEILTVLCKIKASSATRDPRFGGIRHGMAPVQASQTQGGNLCPTCGKPLA